MKKISKEQQMRLDELRAEYTAAREQVEQAKIEAEAEIAKIVENINEKIRDVNTVIANANELADQIASEIEDYVGERSEQWQESDRASAYADWSSQWQESLDEVDEVDAPEIQVELPDELMPEDAYPSEPQT